MKSVKFSPEFRERAVRMGAECRVDPKSTVPIRSGSN
jgi:transposase-like protein